MNPTSQKSQRWHTNLLLLAGAVLVGLGGYGMLLWLLTFFPQPTPHGARELLGTSEGTTLAAFQQDSEAGEDPFPRGFPAPSLREGTEWLNTAGPLEVEDLKGKFVVLDFWTYCCINCIHILPELKKLERAYPNNVVVIGVHSAKFEGEKSTKNIQEAILRYEIEHPVVNDAEMKIWKGYQIGSWPSLRVIDPKGRLVAGRSGEVTFEELDGFLKRVLPYYRKKGLLNETPLQFDLERLKARQTSPLLFPGKVLADEDSGRLFIADSNHNRVVISTLDGQLQAIIGSGAIGSADGTYSKASFNKPQGMALKGKFLYVADTENHLLRKVDLKARMVTTIAGTGQQRRERLWPGMDLSKIQSLEDLEKIEKWVGPPDTTSLNSPWDLLIHKDTLYIAMAGPHQIWSMSLDEKGIGPYAGNGREDIIDGALLPKFPGQTETQDGQPTSAFAQPSGLASDGKSLFVADSEGSSIRAVPFTASQSVSTVVGTPKLPAARLFAFGDRDGTGLLQPAGGDAAFFTAMRADQPIAQATDGPLLQHPLGVSYLNGKLYVADTYNNKIKLIDLQKKSISTIAGTGQAGLRDNPAQFDEPAGLSSAGAALYVADTNNHAIRVISLADNQVSTLKIAGLKPPAEQATRLNRTLGQAAAEELKPTAVQTVDGAVRFQVKLSLPEGFKLNPLAPLRYRLESLSKNQGLNPGALETNVRVSKPSQELSIPLPVTQPEGNCKVRVSTAFYYCKQGKEGLCKMGTAAWVIPLKWSPQAEQTLVILSHQAE